jgi:hypothetical protein
MGKQASVEDLTQVAEWVLGRSPRVAEWGLGPGL